MPALKVLLFGKAEWQRIIDPPPLFVRILSIITDSKIRGDFPPGLILKKFAKNA